MCDNSLNVVGGGSLEIAEEPKLNESIESQKVEKNNNEELASKTADVAIHTSKFDGEGNSSIDMPSFQTEHEATFLWNKAKIVNDTRHGGGILSPHTQGSSIVEKGDSLVDGSIAKPHNLSTSSPYRINIAAAEKNPKPSIESFKMPSNK